jgi:hypothetical protein
MSSFSAGNTWCSFCTVGRGVLLGLLQHGKVFSGALLFNPPPPKKKTALQQTKRKPPEKIGRKR